LTAVYYDTFRDRLLDDYEHGNARVEAALAFARDALAGCDRILDVGCGIGWTTHELALAGHEAHGLDLSPVLIETARQMFDCPFVAADFTRTTVRPFDGVLMVDVYEHFPRDSRPRVHRNLRATGASRFALTVPTPEALAYAREHGIPLQPVDEDVTDAHLERLAADLGGELVVNHVVSIWRDGDYRHALIVRDR